jgi:hypothetical protein
MGGRFIWPHFAVEFGELFKASRDGADWTAKIEALQSKAELLEYLYQRMTRIQFEERVEPVDPAAAVAAIVKSDYQERTQLIWDMHEAIDRLVDRGVINETSFNELESFYRQRKEAMLRTTSGILDAGSKLDRYARWAQTWESLHSHPLLAAGCGLVANIAREAPRIAATVDLIRDRLPTDRSLYFGNLSRLEAIARPTDHNT